MIGGGSDLPKSPGAERERIVVALALRPGYSGGPMVGHQGTLIGMSILMVGLEVGMAVPSPVLEEFVANASSADWSGSGTILV